MQIPADWQVEWVAPDAPFTPGAVRLSMSALTVRAGSLSMAFWRDRWGAFGLEENPKRIGLPSFPTLDELWTLYLITRAEAIHPSWQAMCRYAEDVRQGHWPDRVGPEQAVQAIYLAIAHEHLLRGPEGRSAFLFDVAQLFDCVATSLEKGARLLDDPIVAGEPAMQRYSAMLVSDRGLYAEDRQRGQAYWATIPAPLTATGTERRLPLLALRRPVATQFKLWARRDPHAPGGHGYPLLLVEHSDGQVVLSTDPSSKLRVGALAPQLSELERTCRGTDAPWYDGANHGGTLVASPRDGTRIPPRQLLALLENQWALRRVGSASGASRRWLGAVAACVLAAAGGGYLALNPSDRTETTAPALSGAKGDPIPPQQVLNLLRNADEGPRSFTQYAMVAGVCSYTGGRELRAPCRDARAVRNLLVNVYGYREENVILLVDDAKPGERVAGTPTAANLRLTVERFREKFGDNERSSFLFFYSGHGGYEKGARKDFGVLQPTGYFERQDLPISDRGWDMQELLDAIKKGVPSRHVMVVLDACYSGWAVGSKGEDHLRTELMSLWNERAEVVLSAGTKGQRAWEDEESPGAWVWNGHSAMTAFLLQGLSPGKSGLVPADVNQDGVVTDEELARFLRQRVPESVRETKRAEQVPQFFRFDEHLPQSGQFLFVPTGTAG